MIRILRIPLLSNIFFFIFTQLTIAQDIKVNPTLLRKAWPAFWITEPNSPQREYGIYHFRKEFNLKKKPATFIIHVSADNRYRLFVNGHPVTSGPARGDTYNWYYESVDIATLLNPGVNIIAAQVWNMGYLAPVAQISNQTAFIVQGDSELEFVVNTDNSWKVTVNKSYTPCSIDNMERLRAYMVVGPGDNVNGALYPWGWELPNYNDSKWPFAQEIVNAEPVGSGTDNRWSLVPRNIPLFNEDTLRITNSRRSVGNMDNLSKELDKPLIISPYQKVTLLFDLRNMNVAYPEIITSLGTGSSIRVTYAEALFDKNGNKGNRNEITGKAIKGNYDLFYPDGGLSRKFRPLWLRAFRYLQLDISTKDKSLIIDKLYGLSTGYPLQLKAAFECNDPSLKDIWDVGWRTARLCAGEVYFDTPYYEQLQYTGDTRIQSLISLYMTGDDRLMRKAILDFYHSRTPEGLTQGRYPSNRLQIIPPFSLFWISMIHDYWMYRRDDAFVKQFLPAINEILIWYKNRIDLEKQMLGPLSWWNFVDWDNFNGWGSAPGTESGNSSILSLQYAYTLQEASDLSEAFKHHDQATEYRRLARKLISGTFKNCYDSHRGLIADTPDKLTYSQHAGIWAILASKESNKFDQILMNNILTNKDIGQVTFFYRFYLNQALKKSGLAEKYIELLGPWKDMLKLGLTTFAEKPEPTRSDCHAWSASPNYDFLATICGITPASPGFRKVLIEPALGVISELSAQMPCPDGLIQLHIKKNRAAGLVAEITLPYPLKGIFKWNGMIRKLSSGKQQIKISHYKQ